MSDAEQLFEESIERPIRKMADVVVRSRILPNIQVFVDSVRDTEEDHQLQLVPDLLYTRLQRVRRFVLRATRHHKDSELLMGLPSQYRRSLIFARIEREVLDCRTPVYAIRRGCHFSKYSELLFHHAWKNDVASSLSFEAFASYAHGLESFERNCPRGITPMKPTTKRPRQIAKRDSDTEPDVP